MKHELWVHKILPVMAEYFFQPPAYRTIEIFYPKREWFGENMASSLGEDRFLASYYVATLLHYHSEGRPDVLFPNDFVKIGDI